MRPLIYWHICNLALCVGQDAIAARPCPESAGCSSGSSADDLLHIEPPAALQGEILLQAKQSRSKVAPADAPNFSQTEKVGDGKEHVEGAIADVVHGAGATNRSGRPVLRAASHEEIEKLDRRAMSGLERPFQVTPPLKEPAARADENYMHDKQNVGQLDYMMPGQTTDSSWGSVKQAMHVAVSIMLLGFVAFVMGLFYLVNWPDEDIRQATWRLLSTTISIFLAVLIFSAVRELMSGKDERQRHAHERDVEAGNVAGDLGHYPADGSVSRSEVLFSFSRYLILWILFQLVLFGVDTRTVLVKAISKLGSHIVAFAGVDAFATFQESEFFSDTFAHNLAGLALSVLLVWGVFDVAEYFRWRFVRENMEGEDRIDKARQLWYEECRVGEHEAAGVILGLLLSQTVRYAITGHHAPLHGGHPMDKSTRQVYILFGVGLLLGVIVVPIEIGLKRLGLALVNSEISWKHWPPRLIRVCRETLSMTMAWCFLYWGQWEFWHITRNSGLGWGSKMSAVLSIALILSLLCFFGIFIIDLIADRLENRREHQAGFVALGNAFGLIMGLGWESCFREAVDGVSTLEKNFGYGYLVTHVSLIVVLCLLVLPAWILFIYPQSLVNRREDLLHHHHHLHSGPL
mmetsp:Transcript_116193/g.205783  ORF Transcript_116193/g.205783 Transcript_116193/m.205783 type:complete len:631 (+) Transcript_116193:78-1970(+)